MLPSLGVFVGLLLLVFHRSSLLSGLASCFPSFLAFVRLASVLPSAFDCVSAPVRLFQILIQDLNLNPAIIGSKMQDPRCPRTLFSSSWIRSCKNSSLRRCTLATMDPRFTRRVSEHLGSWILDPMASGFKFKSRI